MNSHTIQAIDLLIEELGLLEDTWKQLGHSLALKLILSVILKGSSNERTLALNQSKKLISEIGWIDFIGTLGTVLYSSLAHRS